jgi:hypothetical protein
LIGCSGLWHCGSDGGPLVRLAASVPIFIPMGPGADSTMIHNTGADIRLLKAPPTPAPPRGFDAAALKARLDPLVNGPKCEKEMSVRTSTTT